MTQLESLAEPVVTKMLTAEEDQLYEILGIRLKAITRDPSLAGSFDLEVTYDTAEMGLKEDVLALGRRVFRRWSVEARLLLCGDSPDEKGDREKLREAVGVGEVAVAAALTSLLIAHLGVAPALAGVVAAIVCKRFFRPAYEEFCAAWAKGQAK